MHPSKRVVGADGAVQKTVAEGAKELDAYSYGAASAALSAGNTMWAWGQMAQQQNYPHVEYQEGGISWACPPGFAPDAPKGWMGTCRAPNGLSVTPHDSGACSKSWDTSGGGWWSCDMLYNYMRWNYPELFSSQDGYVFAAEPMAASLRALGALRPGQWSSVKSSVRAVAHALTTCCYPGDFSKINDLLVKVAAEAYDVDVKQHLAAEKAAQAEKGAPDLQFPGMIPRRDLQFPGMIPRRGPGSSAAPVLGAAALAAAAAYALYPARVAALAASALSMVRSLVR